MHCGPAVRVASRPVGDRPGASAVGATRATAPPTRDGRFFLEGEGGRGRYRVGTRPVPGRRRMGFGRGAGCPRTGARPGTSRAPEVGEPRRRRSRPGAVALTTFDLES